MPIERSPISTDIDFDRDGKQVSFLRAPHSRDDSAWGSIWVPISVIKNGNSPTILFVGGNHGGEYEGTVSLLKLSRHLQADQIQGRLILLPALNLPAVLAGQRLSPIDGKDMNRVFPGKWNGTITEVVAHYIHEAILPLCDAVIDLHSGGYSLNFVPHISMHYLDDHDQHERTLAALKAFDAPISLLIREFTGEGLLDYAVERMGKIFLFTELGGGGMLIPQNLKVTEEGVRNLLEHFEMIAPQTAVRDLPTRNTRLMEVPDEENYSYAKTNGIYETHFELGVSVEAGDTVGRVHYPEDPTREAETIIAQRSGTLLGTRGPGFVERGDCVAVVAQDAP
jgi:N-alpha-acetyl-L-2,4-diaminobutyrate deacetylase